MDNIWTMTNIDKASPNSANLVICTMIIILQLYPACWNGTAIKLLNIDHTWIGYFGYNC